jgi:hypothetical protein
VAGELTQRPKGFLTVALHVGNGWLSSVRASHLSLLTPLRRA